MPNIKGGNRMDKLEKCLCELKVLSDSIVTITKMVSEIKEEMYDELYPAVKEKVLDQLTIQDVLEEFGLSDILADADISDVLENFSTYDILEYLRDYADTSDILGNYSTDEIIEYLHDYADVEDVVEISWRY